MTTPSKESYEAALETIKRYEKRQKELKRLEKELSYKLQGFTHIKFSVNKKEKTVFFSGMQKETNKLLIGTSKCAGDDIFEQVIGKLIAVKKALKEDNGDIVELVEEHSNRWVGGTIDADNVYVKGAYTRKYSIL